MSEATSESTEPMRVLVSTPRAHQAFKAAGNVPAFIVYVTVIIAVSLIVYIVFLKNRAVTALDPEQGNTYAIVSR